jgi:hypothetical protein
MYVARHGRWWRQGRDPEGGGFGVRDVLMKVLVRVEGDDGGRSMYELGLWGECACGQWWSHQLYTSSP